jgi:hypothetical protein
VFHGPALPGVPESAIRRTPLSRLQWGCTDLPLSSVHGPWLGCVLGEHDDTLRPCEALVRFCHRHQAWHRHPDPYVRIVSLLQQACRSCFSRFEIKETPCGSSALRPSLTSRALTLVPQQLCWWSTPSTCSTFSITPPRLVCNSVCIWPHMSSKPPLLHVSLRGWGMRMSSSVAVYFHLQSRTASWRSFTVNLVRSSMGGTTPVCCSTSLVRRWTSVLTGSFT